MIALYFDDMMSRRAADQLLAKGYTVVLSTDVEMRGKPDPEHLAYATKNGYVMVTFDRPFAGQTSKSGGHGGLACLSGRQNDIGLMVRSLSEFIETYQPAEVVGKVFWL